MRHGIHSWRCLDLFGRRVCSRAVAVTLSHAMQRRLGEQQLRPWHLLLAWRDQPGLIQRPARPPQLAASSSSFFCPPLNFSHASFRYALRDEICLILARLPTSRIPIRVSQADTSRNKFWTAITRRLPRIGGGCRRSRPKHGVTSRGEEARDQTDRS